MSDSYFGLVSSQDQSGSTNRLGHITRCGPSVVRCLLTEAAWQGVRRSPTIGHYFNRIGQGNKERKKIALVTLYSASDARDAARQSSLERG